MNEYKEDKWRNYNVLFKLACSLIFLSFSLCLLRDVTFN